MQKRSRVPSYVNHARKQMLGGERLGMGDEKPGHKYRSCDNL